MKKILFLALSATFMLASCAKKSSNDAKPTNTNTVTINGSDYTTVKIGTQTWTAVNYNGAGGTYYNGSSTNDAANGKLYTVAEAKVITLPTGWRLPTGDDYNKLLASQGNDGKKLMAKTSWTNNAGTNISGFNAFASGAYDHDQYRLFGAEAIFLTSSTLVQYPGIPASFDIDQEDGIIQAGLTDVVNAPEDRGSIRFVKDN